MQLGRILTRSFFARSCLEVAPDLVGVHVIRKLPDRTCLVARIVEVEAYLGDGTDAASHSHRGVTPRNRSMFGRPGTLYAYRIYGIHTCLNVVCEPTGSGAAILFRAMEPLEGIEAMRRHRSLSDRQSARDIARGPGRLAQALRIGVDDDGASLLRGPITLRRPPESDRAHETARSRRIGITKAAQLPYRFYEVGSAWVCRHPPTDRAR